MKNFAGNHRSLPILLLMGALLTLAGCSLEAPDDPSALINPPAADEYAARYVSIGNSLTAGFMDGGLIQSGQMYSYPSLIAGALGLSSSQFTQPWIASPGIGSSSPSSPANVAGVLYFDGSSIAVLDETPLTQVQSSLLLAVRQLSPYHNMGVPGATLHDGMHAYSAATSASALAGGTPNSFFTFINRASVFGNTAVQSGYPNGATLVPVTYESASQFSQTVAKGGILTTLWLGNNDILGPATSGEPVAGFGNSGSVGHQAFTADYTALLSMLAGGLRQRNGGLKPTIIVANIPSVTSTPYFVPKATFDAYVTSRIGQVWPGGFEETGVQYVLFPTLSWISAAGRSPGTPIPDEYTLDTGELTSVATATAVFNGTIAALVTAVNGSGIANVGLVDANDVLANDTTAYQRTHFLFLWGNGMTVEQAAATTLFSLDGIHPNSHGYGILANAFIDKINEMSPVGVADVAHVDPAALPWDPTYGVAAPPKANGPLGLDARAAEAMSAIWR